MAQAQYAAGYVTRRLVIGKIIYNPGDGIQLEYDHFKKLFEMGAVTQNYPRPAAREPSLEDPVLPPKPPDTRAQKPTPKGKTKKVKDDPRIETHDLQARLEQLQRS